MLKRIAKIAVVTAAVALSVIATAAPAQASVSVSAYTKAGSVYDAGAGRGWFDEDGDHFYLKDNDSDGAGVYMAVWIGGVFYDEFFNSDGAGDTNHWNRDVAEGKSIEITVCVRDDGAVEGATCNTAYNSNGT